MPVYGIVSPQGMLLIITQQTAVLNNCKQMIISFFFCSIMAIASDGLPTESRTLFNHGAELAAAGKLDEAAEVLRQAAVVRDRTIAAKALALLGQIAASSANQQIAENPPETLPEQRQVIFEHLKSAEQSFTESLLLQPDDEVRQYLETLRVWRHNMVNIWEEYDWEQQRNAELQQRIRWLADWEEKLTENVRPVLEEPNSPRKFQAGYEAAREQKRLAEELARLQGVPLTDEELAEKWAQLPEIQKIADEAAELLTNHRAEEALPKQQHVLDYLRTLLKQEESPQNQQNQDQDQNNQEQQEQEQEQKQEQDQQSQQDSESAMNQPQSTRQEETREESPEEKAERLLMQVRRKEQMAKELRDQLRALLMQAEPVEKDW